MNYKGIDLVKQSEKFIRHGLDGLQDQMSQLTAVKTIGESMTKQSEKDSADINNIMARYQKTGILPDLIKKEPRYGDFSEVTSYMDAIQIVQLAEEQFSALDAHIRKRFDNDPSKFLDFVHDPKNQDELVKMGLATRKVSEQDISSSQPVSDLESAANAANKDLAGGKA